MGSEDCSVWPSEDKGTWGIYKRVESQDEASANAFISPSHAGHGASTQRKANVFSSV